MADPKLSELKVAKDDLRDRITDAVRIFESETGLVPSTIDIEIIDCRGSLGTNAAPLFVGVSVTLEAF